ncbi:protein adenylyltransferase SelO [Cytobacillus gottheilii]|uniref:protein adenylyltransferase SelO n=1 Tax=Cytobacillus gottheilii TaxID=859144 RepID=UPI0009BA6F95
MKDQFGWALDNSYGNLPEIFYKRMDANPVSAPKVVMFNHQLADSLQLSSDLLQKEEGAETLSGSRFPEHAEPIAQAYAGHQFGHFNMLGDGRAMLIGEHLTGDQRYDIQLKGSGRTPFSRGGDGRAALGPMLREYIISEAMHALHIPTTRSLAVTLTGDKIQREKVLPGAVLTRVASSHLRVGTFQYAAAFGDTEDLQALAFYAIDRHYPDVKNSANPNLAFLEEVIKRQAELVAKWQLIGFVHGVMNTDNMTISGETIDYGPCAFMNEYDPATVFSSIDREGRYAYGNQPYMAAWNLARFAESLLPILDEDEKKAVELAQEAISSFSAAYEMEWLKGMRKKLGLFYDEKEDAVLIKELLELMQTHHADYTNTFLALTFHLQEENSLFNEKDFMKWHEKWQNRLSKQDKSKEEVQELMKKHNPAVVPRNHLVEEALEAAEKSGNYEVMNELLQVLSQPFSHSGEIQQKYRNAPAATDQPYVTYCGT